MGALDDGERVTAADVAAWRAWLEANHERTAGVGLLSVRGRSATGVGYEDAVRQALCFGWIDGPVRTFDDETGGQWFSPRRPGSGWAATNKARIAELEAAGLLAPAGVRALETAKANGSWPPELTAALDAVPPARASWDAFPKSVKKFGLTHIAMAKRPETKAARIAKIVADAAEGKRP